MFHSKKTNREICYNPFNNFIDKMWTNSNDLLSIINEDLYFYLWLTIINTEAILSTICSECHKWQPYLLTWWRTDLIPTLIIIPKLKFTKSHLNSDDCLKMLTHRMQLLLFMIIHLRAQTRSPPDSFWMPPALLLLSPSNFHHMC